MSPRVISAAIGLPLFIGICLWGSNPFAVTMIVLAATGLIEMQRAFRAANIRPNVLVCACGLFGPAWPLLEASGKEQIVFATVLGAILLAIIWEVLQAVRTGEIRSAVNLGCGLLCAIYVSLFGALGVEKKRTR